MHLGIFSKTRTKITIKIGLFVLILSLSSFSPSFLLLFSLLFVRSFFSSCFFFFWSKRVEKEWNKKITWWSWKIGLGTRRLCPMSQNEQSNQTKSHFHFWNLVAKNCKSFYELKNNSKFRKNKPNISLRSSLPY